VLTLRDATASDRGMLEELGAGTYRSHFTAIWSPQRLEAYIAAEYGPAALERSLQDAGSAWLIAELDATPIGFAKLNWDRTLPIAPGRSGTELQKIYLHAEQTGKGWGGALLQAVIARAQQRRERLIWLDVLKSNSGARAFYARHAFDVVGEIPFATDLQEIGMCVMARDL